MYAGNAMKFKKQYTICGGHATHSPPKKTFRQKKTYPPLFREL